MDPQRKLKLIKNRESASKSRRKKKALFESLKTDIENITVERDNMRREMQKYIESLEKSYNENESLRNQTEEIREENSKLKDSLIQLQQLLNDTNQSMFNVVIQKNQMMQPMFPMGGVMPNIRGPVNFNNPK